MEPESKFYTRRDVLLAYERGFAAGYERRALHDAPRYLELRGRAPETVPDASPVDVEPELE